MYELLKLQRVCLTAFTSNSNAGLDGLLNDGAITAGTRIEVYRNNWRETARKTLLNSYPVIEKLVGADCFRSLAREYAAHYPSTSGDLQNFGVDFWQLLNDKYSSTEFAYLPDIARLERAIEESLTERACAALDPASLEQLAKIPPGNLEKLRFALQTSLRLVCSRFPILAIWSANRSNRDETIDLNAGPAYLTVRRVGGDAEIRGVDASSYEFLRSAAADATLGDVLDRHFSDNPAEFAKTLQTVVTGGYVRELLGLPENSLGAV